MGEKKYFVLMKGGKDKPSICEQTTTWSGTKGATRGHTDIRLRERGTKRVTSSPDASKLLTSLQTAQRGFLTRSEG